MVLEQSQEELDLQSYKNKRRSYSPPNNLEGSLIDARWLWAAALVGVSVGLVIVVVLVVLLVRKSRLNWYEKNLLEISAQSSPKIVKCGRHRKLSSQFNPDSRCNSPLLDEPIPEDDEWADSPTPTKPLSGSVGSKLGYPQFWCGWKNKQRPRAESHDASAAPFCVPLLYSARSLPEIEIAEEESRSDSLTSALPTKCFRNPSMFRGLDTMTINRDLYEIRQDSCTSANESEITGKGGALQMSMRHDAELSVLHLKLMKALELFAKRTDQAPNPYFKVQLISPLTHPTDHVGHGESDAHRSNQYFGTRSPELHDEFCFTISQENIANSRLEINIFDFDDCSVDDCVGRCSLPLNRVDFPEDPNEANIFWAEVMPWVDEDQTEDACGDLLFRVSFLNNSQRLTVTILKARNLPGPDEQQPPTPRVRVYLLKDGRRLKRRKTAVTKSASYNPVWNEALNFTTPSKNCMDLSLEFVVCHEPSLLHHRRIAQLVLPLHKCRAIWQEITRKEEAVPKWHALQKPTQ